MLHVIVVLFLLLTVSTFQINERLFVQHESSVVVKSAWVTFTCILFACSKGRLGHNDVSPVSNEIPSVNLSALNRHIECVLE